MNTSELSPHLRRLLGDFVSSRSSQILQNWLDAVHADMRLMTPELLPKRLLENYIPEYLRNFAEFLRTDSSTPEQAAHNDARIHGVERWHEGYSIKELLLETHWLRRVLFQEAKSFATAHENTLSAFAATVDLMDCFLTDFEFRAADKFVQEMGKSFGEEG